MPETGAYATDGLVRPLDRYSAQAVYGSTSCKRTITMQLLIEDDTIKDAGGAAQGCSYSRQCLGALIAMVKGLDVNEAWGVTSQELQQNLEAPNPKLDCETFVVACFKLALRTWEKRPQ